MKKIICLLAFLGFASTSVHASTATFNFGLYADKNADGSTFTDGFGNSINGLGEAGYSLYGVTNNGITVTASGSSTNDSPNTVGGSPDLQQFAYLDSGNAGLGVCEDLTGSKQCVVSSDDNVTKSEILKLVFDQTVSLDSLLLLNGDHRADFDNNQYQIRIDGSLFDPLSLALVDLSGFNFVGKTFEFISLASTKPSSKEEFYINSMTVSTVPVPAAAWLFGSALLGFFGFKRRRIA